jgi:hypothetical protein
MEMWMLDSRHFRRLSRLKVAVAIGGAAVLGAGASLAGSSMQSSAATDAANSANAIQQQEWNQTQANAAPYLAAGTGALNTITSDQANQTGFAAPWNPSQVSSTPGYQFTLDQGNQAIQRSAAAQGGLLSGAAAKAMDTYTTGLADQTYNQQYNNYLAGSQQAYNQLAGVAGIGQSTATNLANTGASTANSMANTTAAGITGSANATAAGMVGATNSLTSGAGNLSQYYMLQGLLGKTSGTGSLSSAGMTTNYGSSA